MKRVLPLILLLLVVPTHAALLHFDMRGEFEADFDPPLRGPIQVAYDLNQGPGQPEFADIVAPDGTTVREYFVGTKFFFSSIDSTSSETFGPVGPVTVRFDDDEPLRLRPFSTVQSISSVAFNLYQYSFKLFMTGEGAFVFFMYNLLFSPPAGVPFWDRDFVESLRAPVVLLGVADVQPATGMIEFSQLNIGLEFDDVRITRLDVPGPGVPEPGALVLVATGMLLLWHGSRRLARRETQPPPGPSLG